MLNPASVGRILLAVAVVLGVVFLAGLAGETVGDLVSEGAGQIAAVVVIDVVAGGALIAMGVWAWRRRTHSRKANPDQGSTGAETLGDNTISMKRQ